VAGFHPLYLDAGVVHLCLIWCRVVSPSGLTMSTLATWSPVVQHRDVRSRVFSRPMRRAEMTFKVIENQQKS